MQSKGRTLLKRFHPEGIPWPGTVIYNALSRSRTFQRFYEALSRDISQHRKEGDILDIGTGPGLLLMKLHAFCPGFRLVGLDVSPSMVEKAAENIEEAGLAGTVRVQEGSVHALPFEECSFDVVVSTGSLHHWKDPGAGLNEVHRVLKPGGIALIYDIVRDTPKADIMEAAREFGRLRVLLLWIHSFTEPFYSRSELVELAEGSSFRGGRIGFAGPMCRLVLEKG